MLNKFPKEYENKKISLASHGPHSVGMSRGDFLQFLRDAKTKKIAILHGDVLAYEGGELSSTFAFWSLSERLPTESYEDFCHRSHESALKYVLNYPEGNWVIYSPHFSDHSTAGYSV